MNRQPCKRCEIKTALSDDEINKMVNQVISMPNVKLVDEDVYKKRMEICLSCEKLEYGSTCSLCGCVIHVRTRLANGVCPYPKKKRW